MIAVLCLCVFVLVCVLVCVFVCVCCFLEKADMRVWALLGVIEKLEDGN